MGRSRAEGERGERGEGGTVGDDAESVALRNAAAVEGRRDGGAFGDVAHAVGARPLEQRVEGVVASRGRVVFVARETVGDEARILARAKHDDGFALGGVSKGRVEGARIAQGFDVERDHLGARVMREIPQEFGHPDVEFEPRHDDGADARARLGKVVHEGRGKESRLCEERDASGLRHHVPGAEIAAFGGMRKTERIGTDEANARLARRLRDGGVPGTVACVQIVRDRDEGEADAFLGQFLDDRRHALRGNGQEGQVHAPGNLLDVGVAGGLSQTLVLGIDGVQVSDAGALQGVPKLHAVALRLQTRSYQSDGARMKGKVKSLWRHGKKRERAVFLTVFYRRRFQGKEIPEGRGPSGIENRIGVGY